MSVQDQNISVINKMVHYETEMEPKCSSKTIMKNTYCLFQVKFITEYTNVQHIIITQI